MKDTKDSLLADIMNNMQLQMTLLHDNQTEVINQLPAKSRLAIAPLNRRIIESQIELRGLIVRFTQVQARLEIPEVIPITYSDSSTPPPSTLRNSMRVVKENKRMTAAISTILVGVITLALRHYGLLP